MKYRYFLYALASAALFGVAAPFSKILLREIQQPNQLAGLLYLGAALISLPVVLARRIKGKFVFPPDRLNRRRLLGAVFFGGLVGPVLLLLGLKYALASSVSMWLNLETVATAVLAVVLFKEHLGRWTWVANIGVLIAGILLSVNEGWSGFIGILFVGGAAVAWGLDNNFTAVIDGISPEDSTFWKGLIAGSANLLIGVLLAPGIISTDWLWAIGLGGVSYGLSIILYIRAAQGLGATRSQMIFSSAPLWGVLISVIYLGESFGWLQTVAGVLLVGSVAMLLIDRHSHSHKHHPQQHEHEHFHGDSHHGHTHAERVRSDSHLHRHEHGELVHWHPHWPDLHHRHHGL